MAERVLVTGISGFVGGHVALKLLQAGHSVRGSVRDPAKADKVRTTLARHGADPERLEVVVLDLLDDRGWPEAMADVRFVHHVASPFVTAMPKNPDALVRPAVEGTRRALGAAFDAGVERVVLTSSLAAVMYGHPSDRTAPFDASDWTRLDGPEVNAYVESKTRAERAAWEVAAARGRADDLVAINPGLAYGPLLDDDPGTSAALVVRLLNGSLPALARISSIAVDVRDVAALHLAAMTSPEAGGNRYPIGAGPITLLEMSAMLRRAFPHLARRLPRFMVPDSIVRLFAWADPDMRGNRGELGHVRRIDARAAVALLGRPLAGIDEAIVETGRTAIAGGLVPR